MSCFPGILLRYSLNDFEMVPFVSVVTGITFDFTFHLLLLLLNLTELWRLHQELNDFLLTKSYESNQIKKSEMDRVCDRHGRREMYAGFCGMKRRKRDHLEDLGLGARMI